MDIRSVSLPHRAGAGSECLASHCIGGSLPNGSRNECIWRVCGVIQRVPLLRRYEEEVWLRALLGRLWKFDAIHIRNSPQWIPLLRCVGYRGALLVHLQNDYLGHWTAAMPGAATGEATSRCKSRSRVLRLPLLKSGRGCGMGSARLGLGRSTSMGWESV